MKRFKMMFIFLLLALFLAGCAKATYNKAEVKGNMREVLASFTALNAAVLINDFDTAAASFEKLGNLFKELDKQTPMVGTKKEWDNNHREIIKYTQEGIKACKKKDKEKVKEIIGKIAANQKSGHGMFKK